MHSNTCACTRTHTHTSCAHAPTAGVGTGAPHSVQNRPELPKLAPHSSQNLGRDAAAALKEGVREGVAGPELVVAAAFVKEGDRANEVEARLLEAEDA